MTESIPPTLRIVAGIWTLSALAALASFGLQRTARAWQMVSLSFSAGGTVLLASALGLAWTRQQPSAGSLLSSTSLAWVLLIACVGTAIDLFKPNVLVRLLTVLAAGAWLGVELFDTGRAAISAGGAGVPAVLYAALGCWGVCLAAISLQLGREGQTRLWSVISQMLLGLGVVVMAGLIAQLWIFLDRPPLRTLGETRLWYALLLGFLGLALELRLKTQILRLPMLAFAILFVAINLAKPEALDKTLMPALRSPWFIPHVIAYMVSYAALGLSCGVAVWGLVASVVQKRDPTPEEVYLPSLLIHIGLPLLTLGLVFGGIWAKEAWGHYWSWDPKETWAFLTWAAYLGVVHLERYSIRMPRRTLLVAALCFLVVLGCWFLLNSLPATSVHKYAG